MPIGGLCQICEKNKSTSRHHVIPWSVMRRINPKCSLKHWKIDVCDRCHRGIHFAFIEHLIMYQRFDGYNRMNAIKYTHMNNFLKNRHKNIWKEWLEDWKTFLDFSMEQFEEETTSKNDMSLDEDEKAFNSLKEKNENLDKDVIE